MHRQNPSMPKSKLSELSSVEWETSNFLCSDWLHSTHDIFLANREIPLTHFQWLSIIESHSDNTVLYHEQ